MHNLHSKMPVSYPGLVLLLHHHVMSDQHQSVRCCQALSPLQKHGHEYALLSKGDLSLPVLPFLLMSPGWPNTAGSRKAGLTALHKMEQLQFSCRTELMMGGCPRVQECVVTPRGWESRAQTLLLCPSKMTENHLLDSLSVRYGLSYSLSPLSRRKIKIP